MAWLNLNQSLNSLKGQITNFASEVLSDGPEVSPNEIPPADGPSREALQQKCDTQELEIATLKKLNEGLQAALHRERLSKQNGIKEEESSWFWDPSSQETESSTNVQNASKESDVQIKALQDEILRLKEQHKSNENSDDLQKLKEENQSLTSNLEVLDQQHQLAMEKLLTLKTELQKNFEILKREHEELKNANDDYAEENKRLQTNFQELQTEVDRASKLKSDLDTLQHKYQTLERIHGLLKETTEKFQEENQDLQEEVFKLQESVTKLEHEMEIADKQYERSDMVPKEKYLELIKELTDVRENRRSSNEVQEDSNIDDNAKGVIENLKRDINELKMKLNQKENQDQKDLDGIKFDKILQLYNKYVTFELPVDYVGEMPSSNNETMYTLESAFKTLNLFKKEIDTLQHKLLEKTRNQNHLQTQIDDLTAENDFLTTDLQQYERDFTEMKKNNDFLLSEITALKNTSKLEPIIETHEDNLAKLEVELADSNRINENFQSEIERIERELSLVKSEKFTLQDSIRDLKEKYQTMLVEMDKYKEQQTLKIDEMQQLLQVEQHNELEKALSGLDELKKKLNAANTQNEKLAIEIHIVENDKVLLTKKIDDLTNELHDKKSAQIKLEKLKDDMISKTHEMEEYIEFLLKHGSRHDNKEERCQVKNISTQSQECEQTLAVDKTNKETLVKSNEIQNLKEEKENMIKHIATLTADIETFKLNEGELHNEILTLRNTGAIKMEEITKQLNKLSEDLKNKDSSCLKLTDTNAELDRKLLDLQLQLEKVTSDAAFRKEHIESLEIQLQTLIQEKDVTKEQLNSLSQENNRLKNEIEILTTEVNTSKANEKELHNEVNILRKNCTAGTENSNLLKQTVDELNLKILEQESFNKEIVTLKSSNEALLESKKQQEIDLLSKIQELEDDIDRLTAELRSKSNEIEQLNLTLNSVKLEDVRSTNSELESVLIAKNTELDDLRSSLSMVTQQLKETVQNNEVFEEKLADAVKEKKESEYKLLELQETVTTLEANLQDRITNFDINKQKLVEYEELIAVMNENSTKESTHLEEIAKLKAIITTKEEELTSMQAKLAEMEKIHTDYNVVIENINTEKGELINLINLKHNESVQYHNEIQRLSHIMLQQSNDFKKLLEEKDKAISSAQCEECGKIKTILKEKDETINDLRQSINDLDNTKVSLNEAKETINKMNEKISYLNNSLVTQTEAVEQLTAKNIALTEQDASSTRELSRLREHLLESEENHTQELVALEQKLVECQSRLHHVEERAKQTSTVYTSHSIRANQEVETLRNQIKLLERQREETQGRLDESEDSLARAGASLATLQSVLEQFQNDKERDIHTASEKLRNKMEELNNDKREMSNEINRLNSKLEEALAGLQAANRLGDQLEIKTAQINDLKEQVKVLEETAQAAEDRYYKATSNQQDRVDKNLVKNLIINFVQTSVNNNNRLQVLRILSSVLDFNQQECERAGLVRSQVPQESLAKEFVKFLEKESAPPEVAKQTPSNSSSRKSSGIGPQPNPFELSHRRNVSSGSNNLLFQNLETESSSRHSENLDDRPVALAPILDTGVTQTRNTEGAILKQVLKDM